MRLPFVPASKEADEAAYFMTPFMQMHARALLLTEEARKRLLNDEIWVDRQGVKHRVKDLEPNHANNIIKMFERIANALHQGACAEFTLSECPFGGEMATDSWYQMADETFEMSPMEWLIEQPLYKALQRQASKWTPTQPSRESIRGTHRLAHHVAP